MGDVWGRRGPTAVTEREDDVKRGTRSWGMGCCKDHPPSFAAHERPAQIRGRKLASDHPKGAPGNTRRSYVDSPSSWFGTRSLYGTACPAPPVRHGGEANPYVTDGLPNCGFRAHEVRGPNLHARTRTAPYDLGRRRIRTVERRGTQDFRQPKSLTPERLFMPP